MPRRIARRVANWIDSESVRHYQAVVYTAMFVAGVQMALGNSLPSAVASSLGTGFNAGWLGLLIVSPVMTLAARRWLADRLAGLQLQLAGDIGVTGVCGVYAYCVERPPWGPHATFSFWITAALTVCGLAMVVRDFRRIRLVATAIRDAGR